MQNPGYNCPTAGSGADIHTVRANNASFVGFFFQASTSEAFKQEHQLLYDF